LRITARHANPNFETGQREVRSEQADTVENLLFKCAELPLPHGILRLDHENSAHDPDA